MILKKNAVLAPKQPKILIINPFGIGDVLFTTPLIRAIRQSYPDSFIGFWSNLRTKPILEGDAQINKVFALSRGDLKKIYRESIFKGLRLSGEAAWRIKKENFDICLDFSLDHRYSLFSKIIGIKKRFGFNYKNRGRFLTGCIDLTGYQNKHVVEYYLELLKFLKLNASDKSLRLAVSGENELKARNIFASCGVEENSLVVGIVPGGGGSWGKDAVIKHWPALRFAQVADRLFTELKAKILILGDESERQIAEVITRAMRNKPVDLTGKIGLEVLPAIIKNCGLLITNDGGPMHMAAALGVKSVSVFGPVSELVYGPFPVSGRHLVLKADIDCRPCYNNFRLASCSRDKECLKQVSVEAVFAAAAGLLS